MTTALALEAFLRQHDGTASWQRGDLALTLHMLSRLAPDFFQRKALSDRLKQALEALDLVASTFKPELALDSAMSRLDALYLRKLYGLPLKAFDPSELAAYIDQAQQRYGLLPAWLMRGQAELLGVRAQSISTERYPFAKENWVFHLYFLTHEMMLESGYFLREVSSVRFEDQLAQLQRALPFLISTQSWDLLAEVEICLLSCGQSSRQAQQSLQRAQKKDGSWAEKGQDRRQKAHTTAACLLALAAGVSPTVNSG